MPKTKLGEKYSKPKDLPIDWLKAAMLERMDMKGMTIKDLAVEVGTSYSNMRLLMAQPPAHWKYQYRDAVCRVLGIETMLSVVGQPTAEV